MQSMKMMKKAQQGFTLIELMIVVAIIGILAAVAIPQYQNYTIKAKMANAITAVDTYRTAVALCAQESGDISNCNTANATYGSSFPTFTPTNEVSAVTVTNSGVITATLRNIGDGINGGSMIFTPSVGTSAVTWAGSSTGITNAAATSAITKNNIASTGS